MKTWINIKLIVKTYVLVLSIFSIFRIILLLSELEKIESVKNSMFDIFQALVMGIRFDIVISGYILVFPFLILSILFITNKHYRLVYRILFYYIFSLFSIAFVITAIDIPYFNQFFSRFSVNAFLWLDNPLFVLKMVIQEPLYWVVIIPLILLLILFFKLLNKTYNLNLEKINIEKNYLLKSLISLLILVVILVGIRGRIAKKSPIRIGTAYFSSHPMLNQLGLNPVFTFLRSYLDSKNKKNKSIELMDNEKAIANVQKYLKITNPNLDFPLARNVIPDSINTKKHNVVLVIMESMSAAKMKRHGNTQNLTPYLDELSKKSYYFENVYTAGIHTFNGIFGTLFSFPSIYNQHPLKASVIKKYNGIAHELKNLGYTTTYVTTHDGQFDNIEGFLRANAFDQVVTESDYPASEVKTTLGVPDDFMFRFMIPKINKLQESKKPFFVTFMTASDHGPYYIPDYFKPKNKIQQDQIVEYADWSIKQFLERASKQTWYKNTVFVFVADHGAAINTSYDLPLNFLHSPLLIYAPEILKENKIFNKIGGQIDVFPTIMGILKQPYINNTLGIDLIKESRPYIFINHDDKYGVLDNESFLIVRKDGRSSFYKYKNKDRTDYLNDFPDKVMEMDEYAKSNLQSFQYIYNTDKLFIKNNN